MLVHNLCPNLCSISQTRIIYIGDDLTDEDAFKVVRRFCGDGLAVLVSDSPGSRPSAASLFVRDTNEVEEFLCSISELTGQLH